MTNEDYVKSLSRRELAIMLLNVEEQEDYGDPDDDWLLPFYRTIYVTSNRMEFEDDYYPAIEHECWWLSQEREDEED
jgi:hypothetical protein